MRPTIWLSLVALILIAAAIRFQAAAPPTPSTAKPTVRSTIEAPRGGNMAAQASVLSETMPSWKVESDWKAKEEEAVQNALEKGQARVVEEYLSRQNPPLEWQPPIEVIRGFLLKDVSKEDKFQEEESKEIVEKRVAGHLVREEVKDFGAPLGTMYRVCLRVGIGPGVRDRFLDEEKVYQVQQRQKWAHERQGQLAQILVGVVALLAAVAGYLRLEDATKGYYTTWLRLAAVTFLGLVGAGIWWMS